MAAAGLRLLRLRPSPLHRFRLGLEFVVSGHREVDGMVEHHAAIARTLAEQLDLAGEVLDAVAAAYERWDGRGWPGELKAEQVPVAARVAQAAEFLEVANRMGGVEAAKTLARKRRGGAVRPGAGDLVLAEGDIILAGLDATGTWDAVIDAEPALGIVVSGERFDAALLAIANFVDLKSPYFLGHARAVADLAAEAGARLGLDERDVRTLRRAGLVHDLGRLGVSNAIWDKRGPLGAGEWERLRLHPYLTERMLSQSEALAPLAAIAVQHRERLDGSGYPRGLSARRDLAARADPRRRRRLPGDARAAPAPAGALRRGRRGRAARRGEGRPARRRRGRGGPRRRRPSRAAAPRGAGGPHAARDRRAPAARARAVEQGDRRAPLHLPEDRRQPRRAHLREDRRSSRAAAGLFAMQHGLLPEEEFLARVTG